MSLARQALAPLRQICFDRAASSFSRAESVADCKIVSCRPVPRPNQSHGDVAGRPCRSSSVLRCGHGRSLHEHDRDELQIDVDGVHECDALAQHCPPLWSFFTWGGGKGEHETCVSCTNKESGKKKGGLRQTTPSRLVHVILLRTASSRCRTSETASDHDGSLPR